MRGAQVAAMREAKSTRADSSCVGNMTIDADAANKIFFAKCPHKKSLNLFGRRCTLIPQRSFSNLLILASAMVHGASALVQNTVQKHGSCLSTKLENCPPSVSQSTAHLLVRTNRLHKLLLTRDMTLLLTRDSVIPLDTGQELVLVPGVAMVLYCACALAVYFITHICQHSPIFLAAMSLAQCNKVRHAATHMLDTKEGRAGWKGKELVRWGGSVRRAIMTGITFVAALVLPCMSRQQHFRTRSAVKAGEGEGEGVERGWVETKEGGGNQVQESWATSKLEMRWDGWGEGLYTARTQLFLSEVNFLYNVFQDS
mmetsp:Transcript_3658/g.3183  ORF Transcript_3658/g.3183 Transcript_3658/m.3183 type:complete len:313 (-) Transcript_3658:296-1234(-)